MVKSIPTAIAERYRTLTASSAFLWVSGIILLASEQAGNSLQIKFAIQST